MHNTYACCHMACTKAEQEHVHTQCINSNQGSQAYSEKRLLVYKKKPITKMKKLVVRGSTVL